MKQLRARCKHTINWKRHENATTKYSQSVLKPTETLIAVTTSVWKFQASRNAEKGAFFEWGRIRQVSSCAFAHGKKVSLKLLDSRNICDKSIAAPGTTMCIAGGAMQESQKKVSQNLQFRLGISAIISDAKISHN